jgi:WhiB family redox-sensing transcriptional regulator
MDWQALGECRGNPTEWWYPDFRGTPDDGTIGAPISPLYDAAKEVCKRCSVRDQCLDYALVAKERYGCWGGLAPIERLRIERKHRRQRLLERRNNEDS